MLVSYNWLNKYFEGALPTPETVASALTFHAWEIESIEEKDGDTVLDVKVLPDKAMWALSHRGIAKDLSVILNLPLKHDPLTLSPNLSPLNNLVGIELESSACRRFAGALIKGVKVGPSPEWLQTALKAIGQRSINNIVDASNYVMFDLGQPSHAFDAQVVGKGLLVRQAVAEETLEALDEITYSFTTNDTLITRLEDGKALSIAGIKGGLDSGITDKTTDIFIEVANWDPVSIRKSATRLKLRSDASMRYENGIVPEMVPYGLEAVVALVHKVAGGEVVGYSDKYEYVRRIEPVTVSLQKINSVLGLSLSVAEVKQVIDRFGWQLEINGEEFSVTSPFERTDIQIAEDIIEEIGRVYGYEHVEAVALEPLAVSNINQRFYYSELIREVLIARGFSEVYTSSFRLKDEVKLANAFASDKGYLRSDLRQNLKEVLAKNAPNADLLGVRHIKVFEIGTVFKEEGEKLLLSLAVQSPSGYKAKSDDPVIAEALEALADTLKIELSPQIQSGIVEVNFEELLTKLPSVNSYKQNSEARTVTYKPFSLYPSITRDISLWVDQSVDEEEIKKLLNEKAGSLRVRTTLFDKFEKDRRVSLAFRLVFQASDRTLTDQEINEVMNTVYEAVKERGFEVR